MIKSVGGVEDPLKMVTLLLGSNLEGMRLGYIPKTPVKVKVSMPPQEVRRALPDYP
jgi:hypothetical protein